MRKKNSLFLLLGALSMSALTACNETYTDQESALAAFVKKNKIGRSQDYWLQKSGYATSNVALFFGYLDDYEGCKDAADVLNAKFPIAQYRCIPAN